MALRPHGHRNVEGLITLIKYESSSPSGVSVSILAVLAQYEEPEGVMLMILFSGGSSGTTS